MQDQSTLSILKRRFSGRRNYETRDWYDYYENIETNDHLYYDKDEPERKWMAKKKARLIIYPKDIEMIYGKSARFSRRLLQTIRAALGKGKDQPVTIVEFCDYTGIKWETVNDFIMES
jgi:hypothetical protein